MLPNQVVNSRILGIGLDQIQLESRIESYGMDSRVAVESRNWLAKEIDADIAVLEMLGAATLDGMRMVAATKRSLRQPSWSG